MHEGDGEEAAIHDEEPLPADEQSPEVAQPSEAPLYRIALPLVVLADQHRASSSGLPGPRAPFGWDAHADATAAERTAKRATIIATIRHQLHGSLLGTATGARDVDGIQGLLSEPHLRTSSTVQVETQRKAIAVNHEHPLRPFALPGQADVLASLLSGYERAIYNWFQNWKRYRFLKQGQTALFRAKGYIEKWARGGKTWDWQEYAARATKGSVRDIDNKGRLLPQSGIQTGRIPTLRALSDQVDVSLQTLGEAMLILRYAPKEAKQVMKGTLPFARILNTAKERKEAERVLPAAAEAASQPEEQLDRSQQQLSRLQNEAPDVSHREDTGPLCASTVLCTLRQR